MSLLWVVPLRNLLPLLRAQPPLFHRAVRQAMPHLSVDYLMFSPPTVRSGFSSSHMRHHRHAAQRQDADCVLQRCTCFMRVPSLHAAAHHLPGSGLCLPADARPPPCMPCRPGHKCKLVCCLSACSAPTHAD